MSQRVAHHQNRIVTGLLIATLLVIVIASIPAVAVAGMSAKQSEFANPVISDQSGALQADADSMVQSGMGGMGQFCPMMFGCNMMSSVGHCAPTVLISDVPVCERAVSYTVAVSVTEAPLHPAQISSFHFRPPIV